MGAISDAIAFAKVQIDEGRPICVASQLSVDHAVGITMALLQELFNEDGRYIGSKNGLSVSKKTIRARLEWIQSDCPGINPSRATMNRVNEYFMSPPSLRSRK